MSTAIDALPGGASAPAQTTPVNPLVPQAANVVAPAAITAASPAAVSAGTAANPAALTATNPAAPTAYAAVVNMTNPVTKTEGETLSAAHKTLRDEVATYELAISAAVVDLAAIRAEVVKLVTDVATHRTEINAIRAEYIKTNTDLAAARTALVSEIAALKTATLQASA